MFLRIGAANYVCRVFLNGRLLARHEGGFTPFCVELTDALRSHNRLILQVDNARDARQVPSLNYDWFNYGGLTREVSLLRVPTRFIQDAFLALSPIRMNGSTCASGCPVRAAANASRSPCRSWTPA